MAKELFVVIIDEMEDYLPVTEHRINCRIFVNKEDAMNEFNRLKSVAMNDIRFDTFHEWKDGFTAHRIDHYYGWHFDVRIQSCSAE
jgi:hypothetical protein